MPVVNTLTPVFALILLGVILRRGGFANDPFFRNTNRLVYWVAVPCQLFYQSAEAPIPGDAALRVFITLLAGVAGCLGLGFLAAMLLHLPRQSVGAFIQGSYRGNLVYIGLPVILLSAAGGGQEFAGVQALAALSIALLVPVYNLIAVPVLLSSAGDAGDRRKHSLRRFTLALATNPLILACLAGLVFSLASWQIPPALRQTCVTLSQMATPLALLGIGASLTLTSLRSRLAPAAVASAIKLCGAPLVGYLVASRLGLSPLELRVALIYLASPAAPASYIMAQELGADDRLAGSIVVLSTIFSIPALAAALLIG